MSHSIHSLRGRRAVAIVALATIACSPGDDSGDADAALADAEPADAANQDDRPLDTARFEAAARRICREICACGSSEDDFSGGTFCFTFTANCCTEFVTLHASVYACEYAYIDRFAEAAAACLSNAGDDCACRALRDCVAWAEETVCPPGDITPASYLSVPQSCFETGRRLDAECCETPDDAVCPPAPER
jgi:hypothetical protein